MGGKGFSRTLNVCLECRWCALCTASHAGKRWRGGIVFDRQSVVVHLVKLVAAV